MGNNKVTNEETTESLEKFLRKDKFTNIKRAKGNGTTGVDVEAKKDNQTYYFEVIGYSDKPPKRSKDFFQVFFRAISRLKKDETNSFVIIVLPEYFKRGMKVRVENYGDSWERLGNAFPELYVWFVCNENGVEKYKWNELQNINN